MEISKNQLNIELGFINKLFNSLIKSKALKLWEDQGVQGSASKWVFNTIQFFK